MKVMAFFFVIKFELVLMKFSSVKAICIFPMAALLYLRREYCVISNKEILFSMFLI